MALNKSLSNEVFNEESRKIYHCHGAGAGSGAGAGAGQEAGAWAGAGAWAYLEAWHPDYKKINSYNFAIKLSSPQCLHSIEGR